jgi:polyphosphate kinase 2 (PPK2 family)
MTLTMSFGCVLHGGVGGEERKNSLVETVARPSDRAAGADVIVVAQGSDAGGHGGRRATAERAEPDRARTLGGSQPKNVGANGWLYWR